MKQEKETGQDRPSCWRNFTAEEIEGLLPVQEILEEDEETGRVRMLMESITFTPLAIRIFNFFGITEEEVKSGRYENAWIDVRLTADKKVRQVISFVFNIVANTGDRNDDHEITVCVTSPDEGRQIYEMVAEREESL